MSRAQLQFQLDSIAKLPKTSDVKAARRRADQIQAIQDELAVTPEEPPVDNSETIALLEEQIRMIPLKSKAKTPDQLAKHLLVVKTELLSLDPTNPLVSDIAPKLVQPTTQQTADHSAKSKQAQIDALNAQIAAIQKGS